MLDSDVCYVYVVAVNITNAPSRVLSYILSDAGSQPPGTATAVGLPSGGSYSWSFTGQGGYIEFVTGQNNNSTTFIGTYCGNVELKVTYTIGTLKVFTLSIR